MGATDEEVVCSNFLHMEASLLDVGECWRNSGSKHHEQVPKCCLFACFTLYSFDSLRGLPPSSLMNHMHGSLVLTYECPALGWLVSSQLFLSYPIYLLSLGFYLSLRNIYFCVSSISFLFYVWLCSLVVGLWRVPPFLLIPWPSFPKFLFLFIPSACQPHLSFILPNSWLFSSLLDQTGVLERQSKTASQS